MRRMTAGGVAAGARQAREKQRLQSGILLGGSRTPGSLSEWLVPVSASTLILPCFACGADSEIDRNITWCACD